MDDATRVTDAWRAAQADLPSGWVLDGLRCASTSLREEDRSDDWIARAVGPDGAVREFQAADPAEALAGVARAATASLDHAGNLDRP
jgi:hypothetical protein